MPNVYGAPETDSATVFQKITDNEDFILMDVRELHELDLARLDVPQTVVVPLSLLATKRLDALPAAAADKEAEIVVFCHHGVRSAQVTRWLLNSGWSNVVSLAGGIDAYAREIDPEIGFYA